MGDDLEGPAGLVDPSRTLSADPEMLETLHARLQSKIPALVRETFTNGDSMHRGILELLPSWNLILNRVGFDVYEYEPGRLAVTSLNTHVEGMSAEDEFAQDAAYALYFLLRTYSSIRKLKVLDHALFVHCFSVLKLGLVQNDSLEIVNVRHSYMAPYASWEIVEALSGTTKLRHLVLDELQLDDSGTSKLVDLIQRNRSLERVKLGRAVMAGISCDAMLAPFATLGSLKSFSFSANELDLPVAHCIASLLRSTRTLEELKFDSFDTLDLEALKLVGEALKENKTVASLKFSYCNLGENGSELLIRSLAQNTTIRRFCLSNDEVGYNAMVAMADILRNNASIQELNLSSNVLGNKEVNALSGAIAQNRSLKKLELDENNIGALGVADLAKALAVNPVLEQINLGFVFVEDCAHDALGPMFENLSLEETHSESDCLLEVLDKLGSFERMVVVWNDASVSALARVVASSTQIQNVSLQGLCAVSEYIQKELYSALIHNTTVKTLDIPLEMHISDSAAQVLAEYIKSTSSLRRLAMPMTTNQTEAVDVLTQALAVNKSIVRLEIVCPYVDERTEDRFAKMLEKNRTIETFYLNDFSGQFGISEHEPLTTLATGLAENHVLSKLKNTYSWVPWQGVSAVQQALRRNRALLNRAVCFTLDPCPCDPCAAREFLSVAHLQSLCRLLANFTGLSHDKAAAKIQLAQEFVATYYGDEL